MTASATVAQKAPHVRMCWTSLMNVMRPAVLSIQRVIGVTCIAAFAMLEASGDALADVALVTTPPGPDVEGDTFLLSGVPPPNYFRMQAIYASSDFSGLPQGYHKMISMAWRPDYTLRGYNALQVAELRLSTTSLAPGDLSTTFADNTGVDETLVYSGPLLLQTDGTGGPPQGPRPFDYLIEFDADPPFSYDPALGNLLVDVILREPDVLDSSPKLDATTATLNQGVYATNPSTGGKDPRQRIPVAQFGFVPEPPTLRISVAGGTVTVEWVPAVGTLRSAPAIAGPWSNVTSNSPYMSPATNAQEEYYLVVP